MEESRFIHHTMKCPFCGFLVVVRIVESVWGDTGVMDEANKMLGYHLQGHIK